MKIREFQKILQKKRIDVAIFYSLDVDAIDYNMIYFSQYAGAGLLAIPAKQRPFLIVPLMELERARQSKLKVIKWDKKKRLFEQLRDVLKKNKISGIGIDSNNFSVSMYKALRKRFKKTKIRDMGMDCAELRKTKTKQEIVIIKKGCKITDTIVTKCIKMFKIFKTEADVKAFLECEARSHGCELAFPTIVASGRNAVKPHSDITRNRLQNGFCVIDFGIKYEHYCTDITRTVYIGKITEKQKKVYNFVLGVQNKIIKELALNKGCSRIYSDAMKDLQNYGKYFTHGLGHGFGIKIHELPNLSEKSKDKIEDSMVFTVEPGIYPKTFGIRIEDDILVYNGKVQLLTKTTKRLVVIKR